MTQAELNRKVAQTTGESVETIQRLGFLLDEPWLNITDSTSEVLGPQVIDWDALESSRARMDSGYASD